MKCDTSSQLPIDGLHRLFETRAFFLQGLVTLTAIPEVKRTDRQAGYGMDGVPTQARLLQRMLNDGSVHPGEGVPLEMGGFTIHRAHRIDRPFGLVLEDPLLSLMHPGDRRTSDPGA